MRPFLASFAAWSGILLGALLVEPGKLPAAGPPEIGFELYSWKAGTTWCFSVLEGTSTVRPLSVIQSRKSKLRGTDMLKGRLASLPAGEKIFWRDNPRRRLPLPPKELIRDIAQFAESSQLRLILPGEKP